MNFDEASQELSVGGKVAREGWEVSFIELQQPSEDSAITGPYLVISNESDSKILAHWLASRDDRLADDWIKV